MIAHKLSSVLKSRPKLSLVLENQVTKSETKDPKMEEIRKLTELVKNMPDLREDKIKAIMKLLQSGQYRISPEAVAESFIDRYEEI